MVIFSFFSGVGMLDLGFQETGANIVFVNEYQQKFLDSYIYARRNRQYPHPRYGYHVGDINQFLNSPHDGEFQQYIDDARKRNEKIGFIGGPPCPDFSVGGKNRGREGENGKLAKSYVDMIKRYRPDFFLFENVKGLVKTQKHKEYFNELKQLLKLNGYILSDSVLNALSYGVPQDRDRIIMIGVLQYSELAHQVIVLKQEFAFPWDKKSSYDKDLIKQMKWPTHQPYIENSRRNFRYQVPRELTVEHWFRRNRVYNHVNSSDIFRVRSGLNKMNTIHEGDTSRKSFKRLHRWRYSPTAAYGNNEVHLHPYQTRRLSVAEAMAIQSLPEWFELPDNISLSLKFKMIGNGVPYLVSRRLAETIFEIWEEIR